jgi:anti-sigma factor RsiW
MKITNEVLMDYVDGTLDAVHLAAVQAHLDANPEEAALVADMKMAVGALQEWDEAEPVKVSEDFWPKLRDKLPAEPPRNPVRRVAGKLAAWLWPSPTPMRVSARVAALAVIIVMGVALFSPQQATHTAMADLTPADRTFIQQSMDRHSAYISSQPVASLPIQAGDGHNPDGDGDVDEDTTYVP